MDDCSIDFIVTDSPYGISFMSKKWDKDIPPVEYWKEMLRICKPGSFIAAAGLPRMIHHLTCAIEDAGWIIRDMIMHLFGSGFPKSHNHFGLESYGTALKPAWEGWILGMKPLDGTYAQNVENWGLGGVNIDASRIPTNEKDQDYFRNDYDCTNVENEVFKIPNKFKRCGSSQLGRWPANLILDEEAAEMLDRQSGVFKSGSMILKSHVTKRNVFDKGFKSGNSCNIQKSSGGVSRFFYCAKSSSKERNAGLEGMELKNSKRQGDMGPSANQRPNAHNGVMESNNHPTVKPLSLMRYILKLLAPPNNPIVLDPFAGSGSTLCAAKQLGIRHIGIELEKDYCDIAQKRLDHIKEFEEK